MCAAEGAAPATRPEGEFPWLPEPPNPCPPPNGPAYEGRLLNRPDDEIVDQGVGFDLGTLVSRRGFIGAGGFIGKGAEPEEITQAVAKVHAGDALLSPAATKTHVNRIMTKVGAHDRAQLVILAYESGLIVPGVRAARCLCGPAPVRAGAWEQGTGYLAGTERSLPGDLQENWPEP